MGHGAQAGTLTALTISLAILACGGVTPTPAVIPTATTEFATAIPPAQTPTPTVVPTAIPMPTTVVALLPKGISGGSLTIAGSAGFPHRDVHQSVQESLTSLGPGIAYSRLLRLKTAPDLAQPNLLLECDLCESWTLTEDLFYEFQLRLDVRWQDIPPVNGRPLTAQDLAFSYQRLGTPGWPNATLLSPFSEEEATGPDSLKLELGLPDADALLSLADGHAKVVAAEVVEQFGDLKDSPVIGTGPWIWEATGQGGEIKFQRNNSYFEPGLPFLGELMVKVVRDPQGAEFPGEGRLAAFLAGQVDVVALPPRAWVRLEGSGIDFSFAESLKGGSGAVLSFNVQDPIFANADLRKAVFRAMDPWDYVDTIWSGQGFISVGMPVSEADWPLAKDEARGGYFADPSLARRLLEKPDAGSGEIQLTVWSESGGQNYRDLGVRIAEDMEAVGFNVSVRRLNPDQYRRMVMGPDRDYQLALGVLPPTTTTNSFFLALLHSKGRWNLANHADLALDAMIEAQAVDFDRESRKKRLAELQRYLLDQAYMFSPVTEATRWAFRPDLRGFHPNASLSEYIHWSRVWLEP